MNTQKEFEKIVRQAVRLRKQKNQDYGDSFLKSFQKYGKEALFFDLKRKWDRIENMTAPKQGLVYPVTDETIEETLFDLGIMCFNGMICFKDKHERKNKRAQQKNK